MKTLKIYLNEDGSIRDYTQDFVINQYSFQDSLINVYVPTSILDLRNTDTTIEDEDTGAIIQTINGSNIQMGLIYTNPNGTTRVGDGYLFNFVKSNIIVNNVNYTLFERLMPKEFSLYAGENNYALNVVNVRTINTTLNGETTSESFTTSLITSATYHLYITASANFDTTTEETTDLENLQAQVNGIADDLSNKQDKEDSSINVYTDSTHTQTTQNVVEGLNDLDTRVVANENNLATLNPQVQTNTEDIATLKNQIICDAIYVGTITANTEPNATALTNFVVSEGFELKSGDVVIWIYQISGATDKSYKCMYGASGWGWYEIPPIENASNGTKGLVAGTWGVDNYDTLVDIVDGKIRHIYVKRYNSVVYDEIATITTSLEERITNIINGTQSVGNATYATYDESERNNAVKTPISSKYATPSQVDSAIQDYALPKVFNDVYFFDFTNSELISDSSDLGVSNSLTLDLTNVETVQAVFTQAISNPYTISARNNFNAQIAVDATNLVSDIQLKMIIDLIDSNNNETYLGGAIANIAHGTGTSIVNLNGYFFALQSGIEKEVDSTYHYRITIGVENETSNNGYIVLQNSSAMPVSNYVLSLPFGSIEFSEAKKGEIFNLTATGVYEENEILDGENAPYTERILYLSISDFDISAYSSGDSVATHIKATYTSATELTADTQIKASINGNNYTIYSPQCNDMLYGYLKPVQTSKTLSNGTYTYIFEFDATFNLTNGFYIDIPFSTIVRLTQTEYNTLSSASLLNDKVNYVIANESDFVELAIIDDNNVSDHTTYSSNKIERNFAKQIASTNVLNLDVSKMFASTTNGTIPYTSEGTGNTSMTYTLENGLLDIVSRTSGNYTWLSQFIELKKNTDYYLPYVNLGYKIVGLTSKELGTTGIAIKTVNRTSHAGVMNSGNYDYYMISFFDGSGTQYINEGTTNLGNQAKHLDDDIDVYLSSVCNQWKNKKCSILGTSLTANGGWSDVIKKELGFSKVYNRGVGGTTITNLSSYTFAQPYYTKCFVYIDTSQYDESQESVISQTYEAGVTWQADAWYCSTDRCGLLDEDSELVIVDVGTNDFYRLISLISTGQVTLDDFIGEDIEIKTAANTTTSAPTYDEKTLCGAMAQMFVNIKAQCPNAKILVWAMPYNADISTADNTYNYYKRMYEAIETTCFKFGVGFVNTQAKTQINAYNLYDYMEDGVHPYKPTYTTEKGKYAIAYAIMSELTEIYPIK